MKLLPAFGLNKMRWLQQTFKVIVEISSILTILSFIFSYTLLFLTLQMNNIRFSDVVAVDDIIIAGVNFAARSVWIFLLAFPLTFLSIIYLSTAIHITLRRMKPWRWHTTLGNFGRYLLIALLVFNVAILAILGVTVSFGGASVVVAKITFQNGDGASLLVGAIIAGWLCAIWTTLVYLSGGSYPATSEAEAPIEHGETLLPRIRSRWFDPTHLLKVTFGYCLILSLISGFSERAWFLGNQAIST